MRIALIVEGETERVFIPHLRNYLQRYLAGGMPELRPDLYNGRIPTEDRLRRRVLSLLCSKRKPADHVIALTDVYTGSRPPDFADAADAKQKMRQWVGDEPRFHPHAALHEFEAWLLPYWETIQKLAGHNQRQPSANPETVNHGRPPSHRIREIFTRGDKGRAYVKRRDAQHILQKNDLSLAVEKCEELREFVNTVLTLCGRSGVGRG